MPRAARISISCCRVICLVVLGGDPGIALTSRNYPVKKVWLLYRQEEEVCHEHFIGNEEERPSLLLGLCGQPRFPPEDDVEVALQPPHLPSPPAFPCHPQIPQSVRGRRRFGKDLPSGLCGTGGIQRRVS